jgi:hypothetical protein
VSCISYLLVFRFWGVDQFFILRHCEITYRLRWMLFSCRVLTFSYFFLLQHGPLLDCSMHIMVQLHTGCLAFASLLCTLRCVIIGKILVGNKFIRLCLLVKLLDSPFLLDLKATKLGLHAVVLS